MHLTDGTLLVIWGALRIGILAFFTVIKMANEIIYLTAEGLQKLKDELNHMRSVERPAISAAIAEARDKGDLSENAEYDAAREAQGLLEMRIAKLEQTLTNARVIDESKIDKSKVQILSKVTLLNHNNKKKYNKSNSNIKHNIPPKFFIL